MVTTMQDTASAKANRVFEAEFLPLIDPLYNFAYHLTLNQEDANDLVQETYLKAFRFIDLYVEGTNPKAWLFTILKNGFINEYRKKARAPHKVDLDKMAYSLDAEDTPSATPAPIGDEVFDHLLGDEVTRAINALPLDYRTVILLCDIEEFKYEEIAKILDVPIGTVRSRIFRARNILKEKLLTYATDLGYKDYR